MGRYRCPLCDCEVYQSVKTKSKIEDTDAFRTSVWLFCRCGCVFNVDDFDVSVFDEKYRFIYERMKSSQERQEYYFYVYGNFIEEITYGRKALDVGYCVDYAIRQLRCRGWLATGIDLIPDGDYHTGDFVAYDFGSESFDFIKMTDVLQCVENPVKVVEKAYKLLNLHGVLLISTPDTDLIRADFMPNWGHWNSRENRQYFNETLLRSMLSKCGDGLKEKFVVKMVHRDVSRRFPSWNNIHLIAQKEGR